MYQIKNFDILSYIFFLKPGNTFSETTVGVIPENPEQCQRGALSEY